MATHPKRKPSSASLKPWSAGGRVDGANCFYLRPDIDARDHHGKSYFACDCHSRALPLDDVELAREMMGHSNSLH